MQANPTESIRPAPENSGGLWTKREVARFLGVTPRTVENLQLQGLPVFRLGARRNRYAPESVRAWLDRHCRVTRVQGGAR